MKTSIGLALLLTLVACGRSPSPPNVETSVAPPTQPAPPAPSAAAPADTNAIHKITGRVIHADSNARWFAGIMEFRPTDPAVMIVASLPVQAADPFTLALPEFQWDLPYAVVAFQDPNGNGQIDRGEDFVGGWAEAPGYRGKNLFLISRGGTFVGDRPYDLSEVEFVLDVAGK